MATISRDNAGKIKITGSLGLKVAAAFISIVAVLLIIINTYFLIASRDMIFESKKTMLQSRTTPIVTALSSLEYLSIDSVSQVMSVLDLSDLTRVTVISANGYVLYDSYTDSYTSVDEPDDESIDSALSGNAVFIGSFSDNAFKCSMYTPAATASGDYCVVFLYDLDSYQGEVLVGLQSTIKQISVIIAIIALVLVFLLVRTFLSRINTILRGIRSVREGKYTYRIRVPGNDELTSLANEFNSLTQRLQETEEIRRRFVADASHELKTPLASIRLLSDSILQNDAIDTDTMREFVEDIGNEAERLARTTEKLLALTKLDNNVTVERGEVDICSVTGKALRILTPIANTRDIKLIFEHTDEKCSVKASEDEIFQIVINIIENAIKYNIDSGKVKINIELSQNRDNVVFTVDDTGVGVPKADLPHIFDRFYRVDKARSREAGGSGLGLSIVKTTVTQLGGSIIALPRPDGGMRFQIRLPFFSAK